MRPNAVIEPPNIHLDVEKAASLTGDSGLQKFTSKDSSKPETVQYQFRGNDAISLQADIQVGLQAKSDRPLCDLELMQFVTPRVFEEVYVGIKGGNSRYFWSAQIENKLFLDGNANPGGDQINPPWMSRERAEKFAPNTTDGHFKNFCADTPGGRAPTWVVVSHEDPNFNGEKHFLWRITRRDDFLTFAVFVHPSGERQPIALAKWSCTHDYKLKWIKQGAATEFPVVRSGRSAVALDGAVTTDPKVLAPHAAKIKTPPDFIHLHANPQLIEIFAAFGATGVSHTHAPTDHPEVETDFFTIKK